MQSEARELDSVVILFGPTLLIYAEISILVVPAHPKGEDSQFTSCVR